MMKLVSFLTIMFFCSLAWAENIAEKYVNLNVEYLNELSAGEFESALKIATELNAIDPADTQALLYIVLASVKAGKPVPTWVFEQPWPNVTGHDLFNRELAERLANGT